MNDVNESVQKFVTGLALNVANPDGSTSPLKVWDTEIPEGQERTFPYQIWSAAGGTIDRMFRWTGGSITPKIENPRLQSDLYWLWRGDMTPIRILFQNFVYGVEDQTIPLVAQNSNIGGTRLFVCIRRDGNEREDVTDRIARISQDWIFTITRGP